MGPLASIAISAARTSISVASRSTKSGAPNAARGRRRRRPAMNRHAATPRSSAPARISPKAMSEFPLPAPAVALPPNCVTSVGRRLSAAFRVSTRGDTSTGSDPPCG